MPMMVPPKSAPATITAKPDVANTLIATPSASTAQARAKARPLPSRAPTQLHRPTEGIAANPTTSQTTGSMLRSSSEARTRVLMKVAVIT